MSKILENIFKVKKIINSLLVDFFSLINYRVTQLPINNPKVVSFNSQEILYDLVHKWTFIFMNNQ